MFSPHEQYESWLSVCNQFTQISKTVHPGVYEVIDRISHNNFLKLECVLFDGSSREFEQLPAEEWFVRDSLLKILFADMDITLDSTMSDLLERSTQDGNCNLDGFSMIVPDFGEETIIWVTSPIAVFNYDLALEFKYGQDQEFPHKVTLHKFRSM